MTEPADLPLSCEHRNRCLGTAATVKYRDDQLVQSGLELQRAEERINDLEKQLNMRTASADVAREHAVVKRLQLADVAQRKTIDNLSGETYELRRIMRDSKHFDMADVQGDVSNSLAKYRLAIEEDR